MSETPVIHWHEAPQARAGIVLAHGVMSHGGWFAAFASALVERRISVAAVDRAGSGQARARAGLTDPEIWIGDLVAATTALAERTPWVALLGWCWGARTAVLAAARSPVAERLLLVAPGLAMVESVRARAATLAASPEPRLPLPFAIEAFSDEPRVLDFIRGDELAWRDQPREFLPAGRAVLDEALAALPQLGIPVETLLARGDRIVDNAGVEALIAPRRVDHLDGGHAIVLESPQAVADWVAARLSP